VRLFWTSRLDESTFFAEVRPDPTLFGRIAVGCCAAVAATGLALALSPRPLTQVLFFNVLAATCFPVALWLGARRSRYSVWLDFLDRVVRVEEVRSFDALRKFQGPLDELAVRQDGAQLILTWPEDPDAGIHLMARDEGEASEVISRMRALSADR